MLVEWCLCLWSSVGACVVVLVLVEECLCLCECE